MNNKKNALNAISTTIESFRDKFFACCWACNWRSQKYTDKQNAVFVGQLHNQREH